jgi:RNA polymerase sigma-70 factor (ECF subfamily)
VTLDELIAGCKSNQRSAQREVYLRYKDTLFTSCLKYTGCREDAQDVLQESFVMAFAKVHQYNGNGSFEGWLRRICINNALATHKRNKEVTLLNEHQVEEPEKNIEQNDLSLDFLLELIKGLSDKYRLVFTLYVLEGYSHNEISELLGISVGTSKSNLARARGVLAQELKKLKKV